LRAAERLAVFLWGQQVRLRWERCRGCPR
jgi:hypothetical protein